MASQLAVVMGMPTTESLVTGSSPPVASVQFRSAATNASSFYDTGAAANSSATAHGALQVFAEMSRPYGFDNLNRQTVFRADGSEHSYFAPPEDYPLEQANPPVSSSGTENVGVTSQPSVAAQAAGLAPLPCSKVNNTIGYDSLLVYIPQLPTTAQDSSDVGKVMHVYDIYEEDNSCMNCMDEQLAKRLHKSSENASSEQLFKCFSKAPETEQTSACLYYITDVSDHALEQQQHDKKASGNVQQLRGSQLNVLVIHERRKEWDPGDTKLLVLFMTSAGAIKLQCTDAYKSGMVQMLDAQFGARSPPIFESAIMRSYIMMSKSAVLNLVYRSQTPFKLLIFIEPSVDLKQFGARLLLPCHSWRTTPTVFLKVQYCCFTIVSACTYSEQVKQLVCYSSIFSLTAMSMPTATTVRMRLVLSSGKVAQEEKDAAAMYRVLKIQLPISKTSHIWDPGIESIMFLYKGLHMFLYKGLHVHMIQLVNRCALHAFCFLVYALLPPTQIVVYGSSNIRVGEIASVCLDFHLFQITKWNSTTSTGITSYAYTMDFINDQWEFIHQQGVQENYNAKHLLLSSEDCVKIREMAIIFITFLPP